MDISIQYHWRYVYESFRFLHDFFKISLNIIFREMDLWVCGSSAPNNDCVGNGTMGNLASWLWSLLLTLEAAITELDSIPRQLY